MSIPERRPEGLLHGSCHACLSASCLQMHSKDSPWQHQADTKTSLSPPPCNGGKAVACCGAWRSHRCMIPEDSRVAAPWSGCTNEPAWHQCFHPGSGPLSPSKFGHFDISGGGSSNSSSGGGGAGSCLQTLRRLFAWMLQGKKLPLKLPDQQFQGLYSLSHCNPCHEEPGSSDCHWASHFVRAVSWRTLRLAPGRRRRMAW